MSLSVICGSRPECCGLLVERKYFSSSCRALATFACCEHRQPKIVLEFHCTKFVGILTTGFLLIFCQNVKSGFVFYLFFMPIVKTSQKLHLKTAGGPWATGLTALT